MFSSSATSSNRGVGAAIVTGYWQAIVDRVDVTCVMAADNHMIAPDELEGDRLSHPLL